MKEAQSAKAAHAGKRRDLGGLLSGLADEGFEGL